MEQPIVFVSPHGGIWPHAYPEALVAASLKGAGYPIRYVGCDGLFSAGCSVMSAHRVTFQDSEARRRSICGLCQRRQRALADGLGVERLVLDAFISAEDVARATELPQNLHSDEIEGLMVDGFAVGGMALHETVLHYKISHVSALDDTSLADFRVNLRNVLLSLAAGKGLQDALRPQRVVCYNTHMSVNFVLMKLFELNGIPTFGMHAGGNMSNRFGSLYLFRREMVTLYKQWISSFDAGWGGLPTTRKGIEGAMGHFNALTTGKTPWVYSAAKGNSYFNARQHFGVRQGQKVLLALLSSYDELYAAQVMGMMPLGTLLFSSQMEWMMAVIRYVSSRPDLFLIIRVHPRELPNLRDNIHSAHAKQLGEALQNLPSNVRINWPSEKISLYDLLPHVDVGLNGWSSTGKELALLGIPVVIYTEDILYYPASLNRLAKTESDYFSLIEDALSEGWSFARSVRVFRWLALEYTMGVVDISDRFALAEGKRSFILRVLGRLRKIFAYKFEAGRLKKPLRHASTVVQAIVHDQSIAQFQYEAQGRLSSEEEEMILRGKLSEIAFNVYSDVPQGASVMVDQLRSLGLSAS